MALRELKSTAPPLFVVVAAYVKDNAFPALYDTCTVQIRVRDRNDNAPTFSESDYRVRVRENTRMAALYTAIASDADEDGGADISYYITGKSGQYLRNTPRAYIFVFVSQQTTCINRSCVGSFSACIGSFSSLLTLLTFAVMARDLRRRGGF